MKKTYNKIQASVLAVETAVICASNSTVNVYTDKSATAGGTALARGNGSSVVFNFD